MDNILFISNVSNRINMFARASIWAAHDQGYVYHHASNWSHVLTDIIREEEKNHKIKIHNVMISRSPFSISNIRAYRHLVDIIQKEKIAYIHCNTPTGGLLGRLAGKKCKVKKVIYQAHGFHFYKGAPLLNWLFYYPIERWLARYTDALITINQEDYMLAQKRMHLRGGGKVYYVPGVGIDTTFYYAVTKQREIKRAELGVQDNDIVLISMGDFIERKNYGVAIRAIAEIENTKIHYYICGKGPEEEKLKELSKKLNVSNRIHFLGYRSDIKDLLIASDIFLLTSKQEGLARSMMEAMASGLPCIASKIRGNVDLIEEGQGGYLCAPDDVEGFADTIQLLSQSNEVRKQMGAYNMRRIGNFDFSVVKKMMSDIYSEVFGEEKL